jgi:hypothetical protein
MYHTISLYLFLNDDLYIMKLIRLEFIFFEDNYLTLALILISIILN